ncbi:MAG: histidine phosphatase family protein [Candidatus Omnitrophota bacterium]|nr:MAG: histidine phosphatase family protein [Candidatus Omnitrophota bacterium]
MKKLILIRHGETAYTLKRKYCGHENIALNATGMEQAKCLRPKLKDIKIDTIYSSDLKRAFQTAKIAFPKRAILKKKGLREINFGRFSGLTFEEADKLYPKFYGTWLNNPIKAKIPNGENFSDFAERIERCFNAISRQNSKKTVALFTHGGPIRIIILKILQKGLDKFWDIEVGTGDINIMDFKNG